MCTGDDKGKGSGWGEGDRMETVVNGKKDCKCKKGDIFQYNNLDYQWVCKSCKKVTLIPHKWILNKSITSKMLCRLFPSDFTYLEWNNVKIMTKILTSDYVTKAGKTKGERPA